MTGDQMTRDEIQQMIFFLLQNGLSHEDVLYFVRAEAVARDKGWKFEKR